MDIWDRDYIKIFNHLEYGCKSILYQYELCMSLLMKI